MKSSRSKQIVIYFSTFERALIILSRVAENVPLVIVDFIIAKHIF